MPANKIDNDIDALFRLPLAEFIDARKTLAVRLKKEGRTESADRVKALAKPSISVWAVNQLYWRHRDEFDRLVAAGQRFRRAHTTRTAKAGELNEALDARREALNHLSDLAAALLREGGHNPGLETMRRIATTLEAISAYPVLPDDQATGRLTKDLDPPGFESLAPFIRAVATTRRPEEPAKVTTANKSAAARQDSSTIKATHRAEETRQAKLVAAKATLKDAKKSLVEMRSKAMTLQTAQKKAEVEVKGAEKQKREAEQRFREASAASAAASVRAENVRREAGRATKAIEDAERAVERAADELESLLRETSR